MPSASALLLLASAAALVSLGSAGFCDNRATGSFCATSRMAKFCECDWDRKCKKDKCKTKYECEKVYETTCALGCAKGVCNTLFTVTGTTWAKEKKMVTAGTGDTAVVSYVPYNPALAYNGPTTCKLSDANVWPAKYTSWKGVMEDGEDMAKRGGVVQARLEWFEALMTTELVQTSPGGQYTAQAASCDAAALPTATAAARAATCDAVPAPSASTCPAANISCSFVQAITAAPLPGALSLGSTSGVLAKKTYKQFACRVSYPKSVANNAVHSECITKCNAITKVISATELACKAEEAKLVMPATHNTTVDGAYVPDFKCFSLITIQGADGSPSKNRCDGTAGGESGKWCVKGNGVGYEAGGWTRDCTYICTGKQDTKYIAGTSHASAMQAASALLALVLAAAALY